MNKYLKIALIGGAIFLTLKYLKKRKEEANVGEKAVEIKSISAKHLDIIRVNLLHYIETRNKDMGVEKSRKEIDHDIMLITEIKN